MLAAVVRLVGGEALAARLVPGQLPDEPVAGLDEALGFVPDFRRLVGDLRRLGQHPLARELAAAIGQIVAAARVDAVGPRLRRLMLPELDVGVRVARQDRREGRAVGLARQGRTGGEAQPDAEDRAPTSEAAEDDLRRLRVVRRHLQRPAAPERLAAGERRRHDAVPVFVRQAADDAPVLGVHQYAARRLRSIVQTNQIRSTRCVHCQLAFRFRMGRCIRLFMYKLKQIILWFCALRQITNKSTRRRTSARRHPN